MRVNQSFILHALEEPHCLAHSARYAGSENTQLTLQNLADGHKECFNLIEVVIVAH